MAAFLLFAFACAPPNAVHNANLVSPTPSPSPTPTVPVAVSASAPFHGGEVGIGYAPVALTATGGVAPYKWSVSSGTLPGGLTLGSDGSVSGTPTASGAFTFTIQVGDSGDSSASLPGTISIAEALTAHLNPNCASYCYVELGCVSVCGDFGSLTGGVAPYTFSQVGGTLPSGTALSGFSLTGTFGGSSGWVQFTVQAGDALGATTTISPKFWMYPHITLTGGTIPACPWPGAPDPGCIARFPYSGGTPNSGSVTVSNTWVSYTCNYPPACASPPPMPSIVVSSGMITVSVPRGYSTGTSGYKGTLTITLTNQDVCSAGPVKCSASANVTITQASG